MKRILGGLLICKIFLLGCVTMHEQAMALQTTTTERNLPRGCVVVGPVESFSMWGSEPAMAYLKNTAGAQGATHLIVKEQNHSFWGIGLRGSAYACL